jgi:hypothetical protein
VGSVGFRLGVGWGSVGFRSVEFWSVVPGGQRPSAAHLILPLHSFLPSLSSPRPAVRPSPPTCPPPRASGSPATVASMILNFTSRIGSSQRGPSRAPHWKPWGRRGGRRGRWVDEIGKNACRKSPLPSLFQTRAERQHPPPPTRHHKPKAAHLHHRVPDRVEQPLVHVRRQRVVQQHVGTVGAGAKRPHAARGELVPVVPFWFFLGGGGWEGARSEGGLVGKQLPMGQR